MISPLTTQRIQIEADLDTWPSREDEEHHLVFSAPVEEDVQRLWRDHGLVPEVSARKKSFAYEMVLDLTNALVSQAAEGIAYSAKRGVLQTLMHRSSPAHGDPLSEVRDLRLQVGGHEVRIARLQQDFEKLASLVLRTKTNADHGLDALNSLAADYEIVEPGTVARHVSSRSRELPRALKETAAEVRRRFGAIKIALTVREEDRLIFCLRLPTGTDGIRDSINSFRREWWIKKFTGEDGVTLDFELV